ncbi:50S ribosomal protein L24 [bacterium]|nr:MAG: 50S ribosomal protein L24 [bacterium]
MLKIKKGDMVASIKGKDRGKKGKVIEVLSAESRVLIEGINLVKKHKRRTQQDQKGGIVSIERPISIANVMVVCKHCNKPTRIGFKALSDGTKARFCKSCKETL